MYAKTRQEVQGKLRQIRKEQEQGISPDLKNENIKDYLERWYKNPNLRPSSIDSRRVNIKRVTPHIGNKTLKSLRAYDIQFVYKELAKTLSSSSVVQVHAMLRKALRDAMKEGLIVANPMDRVTHIPKVIRREMNYLNQKEVAGLLKVENQWKPLWTLLVGTGLRLGEALGLQWKNINESAGTITVTRALSRHRVRQSEQRLKLGSEWIDEDLVFPNERGEPMEPLRVNRALKKSLIEAGIERHLRVHDLRHTAASLALLKGIPGKVVQEMLGHSHYSTTMDIYSHVDQEMHKEASERMNAVLEG